MVEQIMPQVGDVVEVWGNVGEVVEVYASTSGTPFVRFEDVEGNTFRFPERLVEVVFADVDGRLVAAEDVEQEPTPGLWYDGELPTVESLEDLPRNVWTTEEVA